MEGTGRLVRLFSTVPVTCLRRLTVYMSAWWGHRYPGTRPNITLGMSVRVFLEEINTGSTDE